jgi:membrane protein DedA with SNARE-associated domain
MFDWITEVVQQTGYLGIFLLMVGENLFPPIPSELIMPLAGFIAAQGELSFTLVILAGTLGSVVGALPWYYAGKWVGNQRMKRWAARHGRWFTLAPEETYRAQAWFERHGGMAVMLCRLVPAIRTLISVPAGVAAMPLARFLAYTAVGTAAWTGLLAGAGFMLEDQYSAVAEYVNPVSNVIIGLIVCYYIYRVVTFEPKPASGTRRPA